MLRGKVWYSLELIKNKEIQVVFCVVYSCV